MAWAMLNLSLLSCAHALHSPRFPSSYAPAPPVTSIKRQPSLIVPYTAPWKLSWADLCLWSWMKATLPSSRGGLNLRSAVRHAPAAFLASISATQSLMEHILGCPPGPSPHIPPALLSLATEAARPDWQCLEDIEVPLRQRSLSNAMDESCFQQLLTSAPTSRFRALSLSSSLPHAGDWLNVVPSSSLGLHLHDREFRCCLRYWLGVPLHSTP